MEVTSDKHNVHMVKVEEDVEMTGGASTYANATLQQDIKPTVTVLEISRKYEALEDIKKAAAGAVTPAAETKKTTAKKRKVEKIAPAAAAVVGSSLPRGPSSSAPTVSSPVAALPVRGKPQSTQAPAPSKPTASKPAAKDNPITYVSYLNAFSNSLITHPPAKRSLSKPSSGVSSGAEDVLRPSWSLIDFEGGSALTQALPYQADWEVDRCGHTESFCPFNKREGYVFCEKHLLDDKSLPFVPCAFQRLEANPCPYPARLPPGAGGKNRPQRSKEALCSIHLEKCMQEVRTHMSSSANTVLNAMAALGDHNANVDKGLPPTKASDIFDDLGDSTMRDGLETYLRATAKETYASNSSSDESAVDERHVGMFTTRAFDTDDELDSEEDDPLENGHTFTVEELVRMLRLKISKQKELLACELRLQEYKLKDARARYLTEVSEEKTFLPTVSMQARHDPHSTKAYKQLRTKMRFHRKRPKFAFAHNKKPCTVVKHGGKMPESISRCLHAETTPSGRISKCRQYSLPFSRHCLSHILEDQYQYLYKRCAAMTPGRCHNAVLKNIGIKYCFLHMDPANMRVGPDMNESQTLSSSSDGEGDYIPPLPLPNPEPVRQGTENSVGDCFFSISTIKRSARRKQRDVLPNEDDPMQNDL